MEAGQQQAVAVKAQAIQVPRMESPKVSPQSGKKQQQSPKSPEIRYPFWFGGSASSMAACVTHPLDLLKVRLQTQTGNMPKSLGGTFLHIIKHNGISGLYSGISASLLRQTTYSTIRFGVYEELKSRYVATKATSDGTRAKPPSFGVLVAMSMTSGFIGGVAGNPADVLNVRMQHDAALPPAKRRNYAHAFDGLVRMAREEGFGSWFRGVMPNAIRASAMTAGQLASYDVVKRTLMRVTPMEDTITTHLTASFLAGVSAATITNPIDVVKTRLMSSQAASSLPKLLGELYAAEGLRWMFKGWLPSFLRLGPHTICTFLFLESHRKVYRKVKEVDLNH